MASSWMIRHRSSRGRSIEEYYKLDPDKTDPCNIYDILCLLADPSTNEPKRLCLLNALAKVFKKHQEVSPTTSCTPHPFGFSVRELFQVISVHLYHHFTQIRAASLRALRHLVRVPADLHLFNSLQLPDLVCRSLDIILKNDEERAQALKLIRRMLIVDPLLIVPSVVRCLVSLSEGGAETGDRMLRSCLAVLCEFGVLHPKLLICCGGVSAITRNVLEFLSPRIAESLCGVLLHLLEWPETRSIAGVRLDCLAAPYCDFTYRAGIMDKNKDARDLRFTCSRLALLSILRSWSGIIEFCDPSRASGLKAIVDILYLNQLEVRKAVLDLLYELLSIPQPVWTDEFSVAFATIDPSDFQDAWRLSEGFVAAEGRSILPTLAKSGPNVCEIHTAMLLYCFLESGLMDALVEVIVSSDTFISVRATVLLGKLTVLMHRLLPADICSASAALPTLIGCATKNNHQATAAIAALQAYHQVLKNRPASCSLFLDCIVRSGEIVKTRSFRREINTRESHIPLQTNGRANGRNVYHRINSQELSQAVAGDGGLLSSGEMSGRTFINELKKRRRHNSSGSNSIDMTINEEVMNTSAMTTSSSMGMGTSATSGTSVLRNPIPSLKRTGSIKLNKFFQIIDPFSQSAMTNVGGHDSRQSYMNFIVDNRDVVHLNTDKELIDKLIKDSQVLTVNETWDWEVVVMIFKTNLLFFLQRMDDTQIKFVRRIIDFFKPSSNRFSHSELMLGRMVSPSVHAGVELIDWYMRMSIILEYLVQRQMMTTQPQHTAMNITTRHLSMIQTQFHVDCVKFLKEFVDDLHHHLEAILTNKSAHDCLFSPQHMMSTMCQQYFLFIGRFCQNEFGVQLLTKSGIFTTLEKIVETTNHICYIKLIVTALDYSQPCAEHTRKILAMALRESKVLAGRLYATQFLLVLMRAKITNFHKWGVRLLVDQATKCTDKSICLAAMEILEEACHEETYLREMISLWPEFSAEKCGDAAVLLRSHFYSQATGLDNSKADVRNAIEMWEKRGYCKRYVLLLEAETHASQTLHSKNEDGTYCRRSFSTRPAMVPPNVLPHLFGQLARTRAGCAALKEHCDLRRHLDTVLANQCSTEEQVLDLKASLYAIGNIMTSELGVELLRPLVKFERVVQSIVEFVKYNEVYSVRATSLNVLGLIGSTVVGANALYEMDWLCVRHNRNTMWPVADHEEFYAQMMLWSNSKHANDEGLFWPNPYNFSALGGEEEEQGRVMTSPGGGGDDTLEDSVDGLVMKMNSTSSTQSMDTTNTTSPKVMTPGSSGLGTGGSGGVGKSPKHHVRSLSESKTTEGLHMWSSGHGNQSLGGNPNAAGLGVMFLGSRQRINSGTDSNTSGVSSCDSAYGRNINFTCDLQQTLSPIPSSSDLHEYRKMVKPSFEKYNRWCEEQFRKISLTGQPVRDVKINPQDVHGYAKIRHIKRNQRPMLSESAAEDLMKVINVGVYDGDASNENSRLQDMDDDADDYRMISRAQQQQMAARSLKVRSLDRQQQGSSSMLMSQSSILKIRESSELSVQSTESLTSMSSKVITTATPPPPVDDLLLEISSDLADYRLEDVEVDTNQPCYMGICLPRNILNLFPRRCPAKPYVDIDLEETKATTGTVPMPPTSAGLSSTVVGPSMSPVEELVDEPDCNNSNSNIQVPTAESGTSAGPMNTSNCPSSSQTMTTNTIAMTKLCLNCSRTTPTTTTTSTANKTISNDNIKIDQSSRVISNNTSSSKTNSLSSTTTKTNANVPSRMPSTTILSSSADPDSASGLSTHHKKIIMLRAVTDSQRIKGSMSGGSFNTGSNCSSNMDGGVIVEAEEDHTLLAILVNVQRCANPVLMKQAKMNLLELKQKHGEYFQDLCLYSEVLKAIGRNTYRQTSRRFLQELFLDIDFEMLLKELMDMLRVEEREPVEAEMDKVRGTGAERPTSLVTTKVTGIGKDTTSYGSMIHSSVPEGVEMRNGRGRGASVGGRECGKIKEEEVDEVDFAVVNVMKMTTTTVRMSLPEPILSPTRSTLSGDSSDTTTNGGSTVNKGFARVQLTCSVNKFPVRRDRANSLNSATTTKDY